MKKSSRLTRLASVTLCVLAGVGAAAGQTLGQQVAPQPLGGNTSAMPGAESSQPGNGPVYGSQYGGLTPPGTGSMGDARASAMVTGNDVPQSSPNTQIVAGDLLDIVIFDTPDLSGRFRVDMKGNILLPLAGTLHVGDMTLTEATDAVAERYKQAQILVDPQVTVFIAEFSRRTITITGEVRSPGMYAVTGPRTLTETLAMSGGLNDNASRTVSIVHAKDPSNIIHVTLNVGAQTAESIAQGRIEILPGDSIFVARSGVVYMVGELTRPGGYQVEHNNRLTLLEAVALAGGMTRTAKASHARLIRRSATGREELNVDLQKILYGGGPDMLLTDGDIIYVPSSLRKEYTQQIIAAAIASATTYGIYRIANY